MANEITLDCKIKYTKSGTSVSHGVAALGVTVSGSQFIHAGDFPDMFLDLQFSIDFTCDSPRVVASVFEIFKTLERQFCGVVLGDEITKNPTHKT